MTSSDLNPHYKVTVLFNVKQLEVVHDGAKPTMADQ